MRWNDGGRPKGKMNESGWTVGRLFVWGLHYRHKLLENCEGNESSMLVCGGVLIAFFIFSVYLLISLTS